MTYPDIQVSEIINNYFVPVQVDIEKGDKLADRYQALWTPNVNVVNHREKPVYQAIGWLPPSEFAAMLHVGRGHFFLSRKKFSEAASIFDEVADKFPRSVYAPQALYFSGVGRYLQSHQADDLKQGWTRLQHLYPASEWAIKSRVF